MISRSYIMWAGAAAVLVAIMGVGALVTTWPRRPPASPPIPEAIVEYGQSLVRMREHIQLGVNLATLTSLAAEARARYWTARPFMPKTGKCGYGLNTARESIKIAKDVLDNGLVLSLEPRLRQIGVPVDHESFKKAATSHLDAYMIQLKARARGDYETVRRIDEAENDLRRSLMIDAISAADRAIAAELRECAAFKESHILD